MEIRYSLTKRQTERERERERETHTHREREREWVKYFNKLTFILYFEKKLHSYEITARIYKIIYI